MVLLLQDDVELLLLLLLLLLLVLGFERFLANEDTTMTTNER
jgi:hypothetical protein